MIFHLDFMVFGGVSIRNLPLSYRILDVSLLYH